MLPISPPKASRAATQSQDGRVTQGLVSADKAVVVGEPHQGVLVEALHEALVENAGFDACVFAVFGEDTIHIPPERLA